MTTSANNHDQVDATSLAREKVRDMLMSSDAYLAQPPEKRREIANNTAKIAAYLAAPEGIAANALPNVSVKPGPTPVAAPDPYARPFAGPAVPVSSRGGGNRSGQGGSQEGVFTAQAAREGAAVAGALLQAVNFPDFVSGLIEGVFHAIVKSSIEQMEAYGKLVADVAQTLNQFRDQNVTDNQGRDHLMDQFPDMFQIDMDTGDFGGEGGPRIRLRDGVDEDEAVRRINERLPVEGGKITSIDDDTIEEKLVPAARTQLATSRQQLLATMVLMGINRIVVTEGKISAKVMYDFQARDNFRFQRSMTKFDHQKDAFGNIQTTRSGEGESETDIRGSERNRSYEGGKLSGEEDRGGSYYSKGTYKYADKPIVKMMSASQEQTDAALQTKASLAGVVEVNFKSDYFPLEKMADSFQIGMIQNAAQPGSGRGNGTAGGQGAAAQGNQGAATGGQGTTAPQAPAQAPART